jgi:hypothetical protein
VLSPSCSGYEKSNCLTLGSEIATPGRPSLVVEHPRLEYVADLNFIYEDVVIGVIRVVYL